MISSLSTLCQPNNKVFTSQKIVATRDAKPLDWNDLDSLINRFADTFKRFEGNAVIVHFNDGLDFVAALFACWRLGKIAVVPANNRPSHISTITLALLPDSLENMALPLQLEEQPAGTALIMYTSGSTGAPKAIAKSLAQLDAELNSLQQQWGEKIAGSKIVCTVDRQHMYGLPFSLLWPLVSGNIIILENILFLESLNRFTNDDFTLITGPTQMAQLPSTLHWAKISQHCRAVFCAGAPLAVEAATQAQAFFKQPITEIYGSTETGALAYRHQLSDPAWQCLPTVSVRIDDSTKQIEVHSKAATEDGSWLSLADTGEQAEGAKFKLQARLDRIVKVAGKRISLSTIERELCQHPLVDNAHGLFLSERKARIGAVVCLTPEGNKQLTNLGRAAMNNSLKAHLTGQVEQVALPRYWRYLDVLPKNSQGKIDNAGLAELFTPESQPLGPQILSKNLDQDVLTLALKIPSQLRYFNGHFSGNPILPGVVQLNWAMKYGKECFAGLGDFVAIDVVKFQRIIRPAAVLTLELSYNRPKNKLSFLYKDDLKQYSSGSISFSQND